MLSACGAGQQYVPVDIRDTGASIVSVRADWHPRRQTEGPGGPTVEDGMEFQYLRAEGDDSQELSAGQVLAIGGRSVTGPQQVSHKADVTYAHIAYGGTGRWPRCPVEMDAFMGAGRVDFHLRSSVTTSAPLTLETGQADYGLSMGLGLRWWFTGYAAVEGRLVLFTQNPFSYFAGTFGKGDQTDLLAGELALVIRPVRHMAFRAGYATIDCTPEKTDGSPLDAQFSGPFLGLGIAF